MSPKFCIIKSHKNYKNFSYIIWTIFKVFGIILITRVLRNRNNMLMFCSCSSIVLCFLLYNASIIKIICKLFVLHHSRHTDNFSSWNYMWEMGNHTRPGLIIQICWGLVVFPVARVCLPGQQSWLRRDFPGSKINKEFTI